MTCDPSDRQSRILERLRILKLNMKRIPGCRNILQIETGYCIIKHCADLQPYWGYQRYQVINKAFIKSIPPYSIAAALSQCLKNISGIKNKLAYFFGLVNNPAKRYCITQNYYDERIWPLIKAGQEGTRDRSIAVEVYFIKELYGKGESNAKQ